MEPRVKLGVDNIYIYNFKVNKEALSKVTYEDRVVYQVVREDSGKGINLKYSETHKNKEISYSTNLSFNPNIFLKGSNTGNSNAKELFKAVTEMVDYLGEDGLKIDLREAKVRTGAFNLNFAVEFSLFSDTFFLLIFQQEGKVTFHGSVIDNPYGKLEENVQSLYQPIKNHTKRGWYDKAAKEGLKDPLSRYEVECSAQLFRRRCEQAGYSNTLEDFILGFDEIGKNIILKDLKKHITKAVEFLETKHRARIASEMKQFKKNSRAARTKGKGFQIGVYDYLIKKFKVYDKEFLKAAYKECDQSSNYSKEARKIDEKYSYLDTKNQIGEISRMINFF